MAQTNKLIIYEGAMCCSSGVCGPNPDQNLIGFQDTLDYIIKSGVAVERYSITQNPIKFMEDPQIIKLVKEQQLKVLPITTLNGNVVKTGSYPTKDELLAVLNMKDSSKQPSAPQAKAAASQGCCSGSDCCDISCGPQYKSVHSEGNSNTCCC